MIKECAHESHRLDTMMTGNVRVMTLNVHMEFLYLSSTQRLSFPTAQASRRNRKHSVVNFTGLGVLRAARRESKQRHKLFPLQMKAAREVPHLFLFGLQSPMFI